MMNLYYSTVLEDGRKLFLAPLSSRRLAACADVITDASGYFLFEETQSSGASEIEILAQVHDDKAAFRLSRLFSMA